MTFQVRRVIADDHPALAGHFPGNPIVPGVLILDEVLQAVEQWRGQFRLKKIESVKFTTTLKPGNVFNIMLREEGRSRIVFECLLGNSTIASGRLQVEFEVGAS